MGYCDENPAALICTDSNLSDLENTVFIPTTTTPASIKPTPYQPSKILNIAAINDPNTHVKFFGADVTINGWIVLVGCLSVSFFLVFIGYRITKKWCDICETRALRPPPTIARVINLTIEDERRERQQRKKARKRGKASQSAENDNIIYNVPIESLGKMMRMQQQQLPGIETNRHLPQLCELRIFNNVETDNVPLATIPERSGPRDEIEMAPIETPAEVIRARENTATAPTLSIDMPVNDNRAFRDDGAESEEGLPDYGTLRQPRRDSLVL